MNILEVYQKFDMIPYSFVLSDGTRFETTTMQHSDGVWYAYIYQMKGTIREHLYTFATGPTEKEAVKNLVNLNS